MISATSTNKARSLLKKALDLNYEVDLKAVKHFFTLVQGEDKKDMEKFWEMKADFQDMINLENNKAI